MFKILSYPIKDGDPTWPGNPTCSLEPHTSIAKGDTANTATIHLFNHYGTHLDGPMHFNPNGISLDKVPVERFFYQKPLVIDVPKKAGEKILTEDLIPYKDQIAQADFLFLRTGFWKKRKSDPSVYENNGPAVGSAAATYLRENFPNLKAIGLDFVSLASYSDGKDGDLAHQIMLQLDILFAQIVNVKKRIFLICNGKSTVGTVKTPWITCSAFHADHIRSHFCHHSSCCRRCHKTGQFHHFHSF